MSAAGDAFAQLVRDAMREHGPAMEPGEPAILLHNLALSALDLVAGPGQRIRFLEGAIKVERELEAAAKRTMS